MLSDAANNVNTEGNVTKHQTHAYQAAFGDFCNMVNQTAAKTGIA